MTYEIKTLALSAIRTNGGTQTRVQLNAGAVKEYGEAMTEGAKLPPVTVFFDGADHWLADGFHRVQASMDIGALSIDAEIRPGNQRDARLYSAGANGAHGVQRTNEDKRKAVKALLADAEWAAWSDREIARQCKVTHPFVGLVRSSLETLPVSQPESNEEPASRTYKTKHGTTAQMDTEGVAESNQKRANEKASAKDSEPSGKKPEEPAATTVATPIEKHDEAPGPVEVVKPEEAGGDKDADEAFADFDPLAELEAAHKEISKLRERIAALSVEDQAGELDRQIHMRQGIEARLSEEMGRVALQDKDLRKFGKWFGELRKLTGAESNPAVLEAVKRLASKAA